MKKEIRISIYDGQEYEVGKLKKLLDPYGIELEIDERNNGGLNWKTVHITYSPEEMQEKRSRGAGRKKIRMEEGYTVGQIRTMKASMKGEELAAALGISRKTLYRRLKEIEGMPDDAMFM